MLKLKQLDIYVKGKNFLKATLVSITEPFQKYLLTSPNIFFEENRLFFGNGSKESSLEYFWKIEMKTEVWLDLWLECYITYPEEAL